jgi:hypothetical protein
MARLKNITINVQEDVARSARIEVAQKDSGVSRMVGKMLRERMV